MHKRMFGHELEREALNYLESQGLTHVISNFQCKLGEIDLIMEDQETLVFVEVRFRNTDKYGEAAASVTRYKQSKIIRAATIYLQRRNLYDKVACRFDVVGLSPGSVGKDVVWIKDAFQVQYG